MSTLYELDYALLCLVLKRPRSGYQLMKNLQSWPFGGRARSPGAVYPALKRLARTRHLLCRTTARGQRKRTEYSLGAKGRNALQEWATAEITAPDMLEQPDLLLLRFSFLPRLSGPDQTLRFLEEYADLARQLREEMREYLAGARRDAAPTSLKAMELTEALLMTRMEWAERARRQLSDEWGATDDKA